MGLFHKHDYKPAGQESTTRGVFTTTKDMVKCDKNGCGKEAVTRVRTTLDPKTRDRIIDNQ